MKRVKYTFFLNRCVNPRCKTPEKEFIWDIKAFEKYAYSLEKQMNVCLCDECFDDFILSTEKERKYYISLKQQIEKTADSISLVK